MFILVRKSAPTDLEYSEIKNNDESIQKSPAILKQLPAAVCNYSVHKRQKARFSTNNRP